VNVSRRFVDWAGLIAVVAIALVVRFHSITVPAVWYDEAYSLLLADGSPSYIWSTTARDVHPPLYYVLLHYWMLLFGNGVLSARSLSTLADVGTLLLCIKLMSVVATRRATWIAAVLLALLPISVRYSQEIRMYTLLGFWLMGATVALVYWVNSPQRKHFAILYVLLMTAAFYTHYFAALCVLVHWLFWWRARGVSDRAWVLANGLIVLLFLPWLPHFLEHLLRRCGFEWIPPLTWHTVLTVVWPFTVMSNVVAEESGWRVLPTLLILVCAASVLLNDQSDRRYRGLLVGYFFVPAITLFLIALLAPAFVPRYLLFAALGLPLIVAVALSFWLLQKRVLAMGVLTVFLTGEVLGLFKYYQDGNGMNIKMDRVAAMINRSWRPGDEIMIDSLLWYLPFTYYNTTGTQPRIYTPSNKPVLWGYPDQGGWALLPRRSNHIIFEDFTVWAPTTKRIWWITDKTPAKDERVLAQYWNQTMMFDGGDVEARLFTRAATPTPVGIGAQALITHQPLH
jgi:4-amino-4-deoxy-L-arabinose transferase-like glycosyltransferase